MRTATIWAWKVFKLSLVLHHQHLSRLMTKPTKWHVRPAWSESSLCAQWVAKDPSFLHADSEDSGQTGRMPRLIWVFAGRTTTLLILTWGGSCAKCYKFKILTRPAARYTGVITSRQVEFSSPEIYCVDDSLICAKDISRFFHDETQL